MTSPFNPFINPSTGLTPVPAGSSPFPLPSFPSPFPVFGSQPLGQSPLAQSGGLGAGTAAGAGPSTNAGLGLGQTPFLGSTPNAVQTNGQSPFPVFNIQPAAESTSPFTFMANAAGAGTPSGGILATGTPGTGPGGGLNVASGSRLPSLAWNNAASRRMAPPASSTGAGSTRAGVEDMMRGLGEAEKMMERAIVVATEIQRLEGSTFEDNQGKEKSEGMELGPSGLPKLEELVFEYTQLLTALLTLSNSTLIGGLPVPLSAATPDPPQTTETAGISSSNGNAQDQNMLDSSTAAPKRKLDPTLAQLTEWAEARAALEFSRKEAIKHAGKAVLDVLHGSSGAK